MRLEAQEKFYCLPDIVSFFFFPLALQPSWALAAYQSPDLSQLVGLLARVISPSQGRYLNTGQHNTG
jgi:hypothetical protein